MTYKRLAGRRDFTARQAAYDCQLKPGDFVKVIGENATGRQVLALLPAEQAIDMPRFQKLLGTGQLEPLPDHALPTLFPDCEWGAYPSLGKFHELPVYITTSLARGKMITINGGTTEEAIQMPYAVFE